MRQQQQHISKISPAGFNPLPKMFANIFRSETVFDLQAVVPLSAQMPFCLRFKALQNGITATIGAILRAAVFQTTVSAKLYNKLKFIAWALQTPFSGILVANEDEEYFNGLKPAGKKGRSTLQRVLTRCAKWQKCLASTNRLRLQRGRAIKAFATPTQQALALYTTISFFQRVLTRCKNLATKQQSFQISPDCSGYNVEPSATLFERKAGEKFHRSPIVLLQNKSFKNLFQRISTRCFKNKCIQPITIKTNN